MTVVGLSEFSVEDMNNKLTLTTSVSGPDIFLDVSGFYPEDGGNLWLTRDNARALRDWLNRFLEESSDENE